MEKWRPHGIQISSVLHNCFCILKQIKTLIRHQTSITKQNCRFETWSVTNNGKSPKSVKKWTTWILSLVKLGLVCSPPRQQAQFPAQVHCSSHQNTPTAACGFWHCLLHVHSAVLVTCTWISFNQHWKSMHTERCMQVDANAVQSFSSRAEGTAETAGAQPCVTWLAFFSPDLEVYAWSAALSLASPLRWSKISMPASATYISGYNGMQVSQRWGLQVLL